MYVYRIIFYYYIKRKYNAIIIVENKLNWDWILHIGENKKENYGSLRRLINLFPIVTSDVLKLHMSISIRSAD